METEHRGDATPYGGLPTAVLPAKKLRLDRAIDDKLGLLKFALPLSESDHVVTHAYNLFVGGSCLEDIRNLRRSDAVRRLLGADRIPAPSTAGDFLRRFGKWDLHALRAGIDAARRKVWKRMPRRFRLRATVDIDSHIKEVYGDYKEGADFSYTKKWSYHPLLVTLAETGECLRLINRPGNAPSAEGASEALRSVFELMRRQFGRIYARGDSKFCPSETLRSERVPREPLPTTASEPLADRCSHSYGTAGPGRVAVPGNVE